MPKPPPGKTYEKQYTAQDLENAVTAIKDGMPKREAARKFNIPRATLQFRISSNFIKTRPGPSTVLTETEEKTLADWIVTSSKKGFPRRKEDVLHSVEQFMKKTPRPSKFKDNKPGEGWYKLYLKRHPEIAERTAEAITSASSNVSEENIKNWFKQIENSFTDEELKILDDPNRIFNGDETGFQLCPKQGKVLAEKGSRDVYEIDMAAAKSNITVMFTFSAYGSVTPPMVVYPLKRMRADIRNSVPPHWGIALSDNGWMTKEIFFQYVTNILHPHLVSNNVTFPVILFVDGHKSHINYELSQKCKELGIVLVALYPNATRILQPADVSAFKPIKNEWRKALLEWRRNNISKQLTKVDFGRVLTTVVEKYIKKEVITNGFRACGLYPWNPNAINYAKCLGKQRQAKSVPRLEKKLTMSDFQKLVGSDIFSKLQNELSIEDNRFLKALENIYKLLKNATISVDSSNVQRRIYIEDEWVPIDDIPVVIVPSASEAVEEFPTITSSEPNALANHDLMIEVTETDQIETHEGKINTERKNKYFEIKSTEIMEVENMEVDINQKEHKVLLAVNLESITKSEHVTDLKKDNHRKRCIIETRETEMIKENNMKQTEHLDIIDDLLEFKENIQAKSIKNMNNEENLRKNNMDVIEMEKCTNVQIDSTFQNETYEEVEEINIEKFKNYLDNIPVCMGKMQTEESENLHKNVKWLEQFFEKLDSADSLNKITTPAKIEEFLYKAPTPQRKGKILTKNSSIYVLTSEKWLESEKEKQNEKEKVKAEKEERKKSRESAKQAKVIEKEKMQNKKINKRKGTDDKEFQHDICKKRNAGVNKNKEKQNIIETKKEVTLQETKKINGNVTEVLTDTKKNNKTQNKYKCDTKITKETDETETIIISKTTQIETQNKHKNMPKALITKETDNIKKKEMQNKGVTETLISTKTTEKKRKIKILSSIPISADNNVKRRLFDESCNVRPDFVLSRPKLFNRPATFQNEQELQVYLNSLADSQ